MKYKWLKVGDQERCIERICCLGPYILNMKESHWEDDGRGSDTLIVKCKAHVWSDSDEKYLPIKMPKDNVMPLKPHSKSPERYLEDWYAEHVLMPKLLIGEE